MGKLSLKSFGWKWALGVEVFYFLCLGYGAFLSEGARELHQSLFGVVIPHFDWGVGSIVWGAFYLFIWTWIFAWFYVWAHNSSLTK